jgi:hypothetical protein
LTGGEAHDDPIATCLIRGVKQPKRMLGDKAHDSAELRGGLGHSAEPSRSFATVVAENNRSASASASTTSFDGVSRLL